MKKFTTILGLVFLLEASLMLPAYAKKVHKPWFSGKSKTPSVTVAKAKPKATRLSHQAVLDRMTDPETGIKGDQIALQAKRYSGTRYRFGGDSKFKGFDCSGLVRRVYNDLNLKKVPRTSSQLYQMGTPVRMNDLRAGDLVFFKNTYKRGISHVGVYAGNNRFVHAQSRRRGVTTTALSDPYYQLHYAGARRIY